jgi:hypothetical protein
MALDFVDFVLWLDYRYDKKTNREVINYLYQKILSKLKSMNLKITNDNLKNEFIAFIYNNSSVSRNVKKDQYLNDYCEEKDYYNIHYLDDIRELFIEIKEYCDFYRFNILDSNKFFIELNFTDFIFQNIEVLLPEENDDNENTDDNDYDYL